MDGHDQAAPVRPADGPQPHPPGLTGIFVSVAKPTRKSVISSDVAGAIAHRRGAHQQRVTSGRRRAGRAQGGGAAADHPVQSLGWSGVPHRAGTGRSSRKPSPQKEPRHHAHVLPTLPSPVGARPGRRSQLLPALRRRPRAALGAPQPHDRVDALLGRLVGERVVEGAQAAGGQLPSPPSPAPARRAPPPAWAGRRADARPTARARSPAACRRVPPRPRRRAGCAPAAARRGSAGSSRRPGRTGPGGSDAPTSRRSQVMRPGDAGRDGVLGGDGQRGGRHVHARDRPAARRQPDRVAALAAAQVQPPPGRQIGDLGDQRGVGPAAPAAAALGVERLPERLQLGHAPNGRRSASVLPSRCAKSANDGQRRRSARSASITSSPQSHERVSS